MRKLICSFTIIAVGAMAATGLVATPATAQPKHGGTLNYLLKPEPPHLVGALSTADAVWQATPKFHNGLLNYDPDMNPVPELAESWAVSDDGLAITFQLRQGVKFHDGQEFTSADVKYTMEEVIKKYHPRGRTVFGNLDRVDTPDAYTAVFRFSTPSPFVMFAFNASETPMLPAHIYEGSDPRENPNNNAPIGTGPFRFVEWQKGQFILAERNADYWDGDKPYLDKVVMRIIPDASARAVAFESGEVDVGGPWPVAVAEQERLGNLPNLALETRGFSMVSPMLWLEFNMRDPKFQDRNIWGDRIVMHKRFADLR